MKTRTYKSSFNATAFFLALLIFTAFGGKQVHIALEHSHETVKICDAKVGVVHLHDYEQVAHTCPLCDFTFSFFELQLSSFYLHPIKIFYPKKDFPFISFKLSCFYLFQSLRAPPTNVVGKFIFR